MTKTTTKPQTDMDRFASAGEARVARKLVKACLAAGYTVSVSDGYETVVRRADKSAPILKELCSTGADALTLFEGDTRVGTFVLIWFNAEDGSELIGDWSASPENHPKLEALADLAYGIPRNNL